MLAAFSRASVPVTVGGHDLYFLFSVPVLVELESQFGVQSAAELVRKITDLLPGSALAEGRGLDFKGLHQVMSAGLMVALMESKLDAAAFLQQITPGELIDAIPEMTDALTRAIGWRPSSAEVAETGAARPPEAASP